MRAVLAGRGVRLGDDESAALAGPRLAAKHAHPAQREARWDHRGGVRAGPGIDSVRLAALLRVGPDCRTTVPQAGPQSLSRNTKWVRLSWRDGLLRLNWMQHEVGHARLSGPPRVMKMPPARCAVRESGRAAAAIFTSATKSTKTHEGTWGTALERLALLARSEAGDASMSAVEGSSVAMVSSDQPSRPTSGFGSTPSCSSWLRAVPHSDEPNSASLQESRTR